MILNPLSVNEIFASIQGEGAYSGYGMIFIRFSGCNLKCDWCDTKKAWTSGQLFSVEEIMSIISKYPITRVCLTGGEPLLQDREALIRLCGLLHVEGKKIHLETNGTLDLPGYEYYCFDHITCSPKRNNPITESVKKQCLNYKFVVSGLDDIAWVNRFVEENVISSSATIFLQPIHNYIHISQLCVDEVMCHDDWRVSMQIHKIIGVK
jgi:7-carboxy-7-deazaguanine synthase